MKVVKFDETRFAAIERFSRPRSYGYKVSFFAADEFIYSAILNRRERDKLFAGLRQIPVTRSHARDLEIRITKAESEKLKREKKEAGQWV